MEKEKTLWPRLLLDGLVAYNVYWKSLSKEFIHQEVNASPKGDVPQPPWCISSRIWGDLFGFFLRKHKKSQDLVSDSVLSRLGQKHRWTNIEARPLKCRFHSRTESEHIRIFSWGNLVLTKMVGAWSSLNAARFSGFLGTDPAAASSLQVSLVLLSRALTSRARELVRML